MVTKVMGSSLGAAGTQHLTESGFSVSSELIFVQLPYAILYFINVFIHQCKYSSGRWTLWLVSADTDSAFFCAVLEAYSLQRLLSLFTDPGDSSSLRNLSPRHLGAHRAFSLTDLRWLSVSKIPCGGPWTSWLDQEESVVRCALGEETPGLSRRQNQESSCNFFIAKSKGNLFLFLQIKLSYSLTLIVQ